MTSTLAKLLCSCCLLTDPFDPGITGQVGAYLTEFLLAKGYEVHGLVRSLDSAKAYVYAPVFDGKNLGPFCPLLLGIAICFLGERGEGERGRG